MKITCSLAHQSFGRFPTSVSSQKQSLLMTLCVFAWFQQLVSYQRPWLNKYLFIFRASESSNDWKFRHLNKTSKKNIEITSFWTVSSLLSLCPDLKKYLLKEFSVLPSEQYSINPVRPTVNKGNAKLHNFMTQTAKNKRKNKFSGKFSCPLFKLQISWTDTLVE